MSPTTPCLRCPRGRPTTPATTSPLLTPARKRGQSGWSCATSAAASWSVSRARGRERGVIGLVAGLVEDDHHLVADELVHLAAGPLHQRDDALEVRVQHLRHLRGRVPLGEAA